MNLNITDFDLIKNKGENFYKTLGEVYCPYFKEKVPFSARGLEHFLKSSHTVQGILETKKLERIRINSRTDTVLKPVVYYEFIAVIKRNRVKIIVKQIDGGQKFFWSLIPFWGMNKNTMSRILHDGLPEED